MDSVDDTALKKKTEDYWDRLTDNYKTPWLVWRSYVEELLPLEMQQRDALQPCHTLVLLVGHSVEPLLQAVWAYRPQQVVLILNRKYGGGLTGGNFYVYLCDLFGRLPENRRLSNRAIQKVVIDAATPAAVFGALVEKVGKQPDVVVDITGAKKSMVAGAFLYAAYANVPVSYVDFDDEVYSTRYNRPYGYASKIQQFVNPYEQFALRDWERVRQLYNQYHFAEAEGLIEKYIDPLKSSLYAQVPDFESALQKLRSILTVYKLWDEGDIRGAAKAVDTVKAAGLTLDIPSVIKVLAEVWPFTRQGDVQRAAQGVLVGWEQLACGKDGDEHKSFFYQDSWLLTYVEDELARIQRLADLNEDYRSAFLRLAAINEVLLKARLVQLWLNDDVQIPAGCNALTTLKYLIEVGTTRYMINVLCDSKPWLQRSGQGLELRSGVQRMAPFWREPGCLLDMATFTKLRDRTVHTYLAIAPSLVEAARDLIDRNLTEYRANWSREAVTEVETQAISWPRLCQLCGVDQFLPPNLLKEVPDEVSIGC